MTRRPEKKRLRLEPPHPWDAAISAVEKIVQQDFPEARVSWFNDAGEPTLRIDGVERPRFDALGQFLYRYRNVIVHGASGSGSASQFGLMTRTWFVEPGEEEFVDRAIARMTARIAAESRVARGFDFIELLVPKRVAAEEIGDAMELIARLLREGGPAWQIYLKAITTAFFVLLNGVREVTSSLLGKKNKA